MTFITVGALSIALLVLIPAIAHMLQRGGKDPLEFSLARLVQPTAKVSSRRGHFDDRLLFALRASTVVGLALLGAVPLIRCDRPLLTRQQGASVALAIVLDDSGSMRASLKKGRQRFALAKQSAAQLISQLHDGDVVTLVLAGRPARLLVGATPQLQLAGELCLGVVESDRGTDLTGALDLAEGSLRNLPQTDHRVALLSDLGQRLDSKAITNLWLPLPELAEPVQDCGIVRANRQTGHVEVRVACSNAPPGAVRKLIVENAPGTRDKPSSSLPGAQKVDTSKENQTITFDSVPTDVALQVRLAGSDDNRFNDAAPVFPGAGGVVVATLADYTTARATTGGPPLIEQALAAFGQDVILRPWTTLPDEDRMYADVSMLVLDDPNVFGPEARTALRSWVQRGGVAMAFLGPRAVGDQLGTSLSPFLEGAAVWQTGNHQGLLPESLKWLGSVANSWLDIHARGRLDFEQGVPHSSNVRGRWQDDRAAILERPLGRGLVWTVGLPVSANISDVALRPAFLAILERLLEATRQRGLSPIVGVGQPWKLDKDESVQVSGPDGHTLAPNTPSELESHEKWYTPTVGGLYTFRRKGGVEQRLSQIEASEITNPPNRSLLTEQKLQKSDRSRVDISSYIVAAIVLLVLLQVAVQSWPFHFRRSTAR
jgi:hypothetical protein